MNAPEETSQEPATEQEWLGNETDAGDSPTRDYRLRRIERTSRQATTAFENGEFTTGVTHLENALRLALMQRALDTTTEGL